MAQYVFDKAPGASSHPPWLTSANATYATAREGGTLSKTTTDYARVGQNVGFYCYQTPLDFDTSSLPANEEIVAAFLTFRVYQFSNSDPFTLEVLAYDFGASVATDDFVPGSELGDLPLLGSLDMAGPLANKGVGNANTYTWQIQLDPATLGNINKTGSTRLLLASKEQRIGTQPTQTAYVRLERNSSPQLWVRTKGKTYGGASSIHSTSSSTINLATPRPLAVGDLMLLHHVVNKGATAWRTSMEEKGWECLEFYTDAQQTAYVAAKVAGATEVSPDGTIETVNGADGATSQGSRAVISVWAGLSQSAPVFASSQHGTNPASTAVAADAVTPKKASEWLLFLVSAQAASPSATVSGYAVANDDPLWAEVYEYSTYTAGSLACALAEYAGSGSTGTGSATLDVSLINQGFLIALAPLGPSWTDLSVSINDGAVSTDDNDVILSLHADADGVAPTSMCFSEDGATWSDWEDYATSSAYQLSAQTSYPSQTKIVYVRFRLVDGADTFDSDAASDTINLEVEWTASAVANLGAEQTYSRLVSVRFRAYSTAQTAEYVYSIDDPDYAPGGLVIRYRIRDAAGSWSAWGDAPASEMSMPAAQYATVPLTLDGDGVRTVEVQWEDDDGNQWTASDTIEVLPTGVLIGNAPPPQDITNWRLQIGTSLDLIDQLDAPPQFTRGEHGPGALSAEIPVDDVMRRYANELEAGEKVKLWDGTVLLWDGRLKPVAPVSDDESLLVIEARGALDEAKQHGGLVACFVDGSVENWQPMPKAYKVYAYSFEGGFRIEHEKGRGVESGRLGSVYYWLLRGRREDSESVIDHLYFADSDIDVAGTVDGVAVWWCKFYVAENPWDTWYEVPANHNGEWNGETDSGAQRIPSGTDSFADLAADHWPGVEVRAIRVSMKCSVDRTAAESTANRWAEFKKPQVYSLVDADPRADDVLAYWAAEMGYPTVTEATGAPFKSAVWPEETTIAAMMEEAASIPSGGAEWRWSDDTFYCRPKPTTPEFRYRWYVVDTRRCSYGVVTDEELRKDYVKVLYQIEGDATYPNGTVRTLYRPSAPTLLTARVETIDLTELGPIPATDAQNAGDEWLAHNSAQAKAGSISGFGGYLRTVDGQWVAACHAREGDWVSPMDLLDRTPMYVTGVEVNGPADVTLHVGGSEREYVFTPSKHPLHGQVPTDWIGSFVPHGRRT
jgi:hypothetical protein